MGLDWNPMARPKPGHEPEFETIFRALEADPKSPARDAWMTRWRAISDPPYATLGAPRVGIDPAADAWVREQLEDPSTFDAAKQRMQGVYVLDLLPECDGFARYSNYLFARGRAGYERYTFRAQFLEDCIDVVGEELHGGAYVNRLARDLARYADALEAKALPWAHANGVAGLAAAMQVPAADPGSPPAVADILFCAIRWCRFWSSRGHGLEPSF